jgi:hypothetical protein
MIISMETNRMKNFLIRSVLAIACLTLMSMPLAAQKGKPGGGGGGTTGGSSCAVVATPFLSTVTASPGINVGVFGRIGNCSSGKKRYTVTWTAKSSCGEETVISSSLISFAAGQYYMVSSTYVIPPDTCLGVSTITVSVYEGETLLGSQSTPLTLQ